MVIFSWLVRSVGIKLDRPENPVEEEASIEDPTSRLAVWGIVQETNPTTGF